MVIPYLTPGGVIYDRVIPLQCQYMEEDRVPQRNYFTIFFCTFRHSHIIISGIKSVKYLQQVPLTAPIVVPNGPHQVMVPLAAPIVVPNGPQQVMVHLTAPIVVPNGPHLVMVHLTASIVVPNGPHQAIVPLVAPIVGANGPHQVKPPIEVFDLAVKHGEKSTGGENLASSTSANEFSVQSPVAVFIHFVNQP